MKVTAFVIGTAGEQCTQHSESGCGNVFAYSFSTSDTSIFSLLAAVSALAKFGAQNENLLPSILVLLQR